MEPSNIRCMPEVLEQYQQVPSNPGSSHCLTHFSATALGMNRDNITISNANRPAVIGLAININ
ncbi:MAG TPA: hypothetical protein VFI70_13870 [Nitrososphaeraceae archaeon]|nr:hypothetical protein [Nitrososphaeraceae archaeon]